MTLGTGILFVFGGAALAFFIRSVSNALVQAFTRDGDDERIDVLERRLREVRHTAPDFEGEVVPFKRRRA